MKDCACMCRRAVVALLLLAAPAAAVSAQAQISVDWREEHQTIVGFGGTMGWIHPHPEKRDEVFDLLFKKLGASVLRIRALGAENGDEHCLEEVNDNDDPDTFDWRRLPVRTTEAANALIIKGARKRGVKTIVAVAWSPPGWMKDTGARAGGGALMPEMLPEFAELWAAYVIGMKREFEIDIARISIQNEPDVTYYYPTCWMEPALYVRAVAAVRARLAREELKVQVVGPDTCRIYNMPNYVERAAGDEAALGGPILTHLYDLGVPFQEVDRDPERWRAARLVARAAGRPLWLMETGNYLSWGLEAGSYDEALIWAQKIHHALVEGDCEVVCYWALYFDKEGEALVYASESGALEYRITPKFYTSMNYYRFVRPGMVRVTAECPDGELLVSAFRGADADRAARVIVAVNPTDMAREVTIGTGDQGDWARHETSPERSCEAVDWPGGVAGLPARSVTTFVRQGDAPPVP